MPVEVVVRLAGNGSEVRETFERMRVPNKQRAREPLHNKHVLARNAIAERRLRPTQSVYSILDAGSTGCRREGRGPRNGRTASLTIRGNRPFCSRSR